MAGPVRVGVVAVVAVFAAGCSGGDPKPEPPRVASIAEPSAPAVASGPAAPERPRRRLDDTAADETALITPYRKCMRARGVTSEKEMTGRGSGVDLPKDLRDAQKACERFWPLPPWEEDPANPEAKDFARDVVTCLKGRGVKYVETTADGIGIAAGGSGNDSRSIALTGRYLTDCQREVAARQ